MKKIIDQILQNEVLKGYVNGVSARVIHKDRTIYSGNFGFADREKNIKMSDNTIFRLFSMTKPVTAAAVMILEERGKLSLDDSVSAYLPEFAGQKILTEDGRTVPTERENTISDLLNMTSGIPYPSQDSLAGIAMGKILDRMIRARDNGIRTSTREWISNIAECPLCFQPGAKWKYGFSADVLAGVVEVISGKRYSEFLRTELFEPLDMVDTAFFVPKEKRERFAQNYQWDPEMKMLTPYRESHLGEYYCEDVDFESGGAGLVSTIEDYSHFASMLLHNGTYSGRRILKEQNVGYMTKNHLSDSQKRAGTLEKGYGYGCLMRVAEEAGEAGRDVSVGEYGWDGWTGNYFTVNPREQLIFFYFIQRCGAGGMPLQPAIIKMKDVIYRSLKNDL